jgi:AraC-like DNA-binding protein
VDPGQTYVERVPVAALGARVRTVWVQRTGAESYVQRNLPTGGVELQCLVGGLPRLVGPLTSAEVQIVPARTTVVGARFWPGAAARLGVLLADAPGPEAALGRLQRYLLGRQARTADPDPLVAEAVRRLMPWHRVEVGTLTTRLAISASQLRRRFLTTVGVGPKSLQRTLRFQGYLALAQAASAPGVLALRGPLAELAAEAGYADHPHLSRECLRLTGLPPRELLSGGTDRCGCGHDHSASYGPFLAGRARMQWTD